MSINKDSEMYHHNDGPTNDHWWDHKTADLPCPMDMTTNKSSLLSNTNVTTKPCSLYVHY